MKAGSRASSIGCWIPPHISRFWGKRGRRLLSEAVLHILQHEGPAVTAIYFSIAEEDVAFVMRSPWHCVCTDGIIGAKPHPRQCQ